MRVDLTAGTSPPTNDQSRRRRLSTESDTSVRTMGVDVEIVKNGDGKTFPKNGRSVTVHYVGTLPNGSTFDSSRKRGEPFKFTIGRGEVIRGWDEGVARMSIGERSKLTISPDYAYGADGYPPLIPPNSTLVFDVELIAC